ncbi:NAD(P)-binding protein [Dichomitus squalens]|uniref:NAD(P)-binding protein n=1 Tax=Dichomitus squalens TaxID=114155 RepID=A0A4Q9QBF3_9APHY|nr:NAD(P)-binding protein [Dichomitus squalens]
MSSASKVVLVTGANQGLGYWALHISALRQPSYTYILCSRDINRGKEAVQRIKDAGVTANVDIAAAVKYVEETYGRLDVLVNNAGILTRTPEDDLPPSAIRATYNDIFNINLTSVAVISTVFQPLLHKSADPKVINVSSGLGSIQNALTEKMNLNVPYGASKIGLNGLTVHMQVAENNRLEAETSAASPISPGKPKIRYYDPEVGAEVIYRLLADDEKTYEGGSYWEFEQGEMRTVPW